MSTVEAKTTEKTRSAARKSTTGARAPKAAPGKAPEPPAHVAARQIRAADDAAAFGKSNIDALVLAGTSFYRGWEEMARSVVGLTQNQVEAGVSAAKALLGAKTLGDVTQLQNAYTRTAFDNAVTEASRLSEIAIRIANETVEPLSVRMTAAIEQISRPTLAA